MGAITEAPLDRVVEDSVIMLIERIGYHYHLNIANRILRPVISQLHIDENTWNHIVTFTEKLEVYRYSGFELEDLYRQIAACAYFVDTAHNGIQVIKNKINANPNAPDKIYREMTANNYPRNLQILADFLNELYILLIDFDKRKSGEKPPTYTKIPELHSVRRILTGN